MEKRFELVIKAAEVESANINKYKYIRTFLKKKWSSDAFENKVLYCRVYFNYGFVAAFGLGYFFRGIDAWDRVG